jgi:regulator of cell morphogenesis and NO signaling
MFKAPKEITSDLLVTDIVTNNYRTAEVFRKYNIDFCCGGKMSLIVACGLKGLNESDILEELQQFAGAYQNAEEWSVGFMIDYLINIHHKYFRKNVPIVNDYINRFMSGHNNKFHEIQQLPALAQQLCDKLTQLVNYESENLFPYIKRINHAYNNNEVYGKLFIKTLRKLSAEDVEQYHAQIKVFTLQIEHLTNNFSSPENACITHRVMLHKLQEFIAYIWQHFFIEKKILIPVTLQMEKSLLEKCT